MVTRETLKKEIDNVQDQYLGVLFKIIKTFEIPEESDDFIEIENDRQEWFQFIDKFAGCLEDDPIERGPQGEFDIVKFFENSPLYASGIDLERDKDLGSLTKKNKLVS